MKKQSFDAGVAGVPGLDPTLPNVELVLNGATFQLSYDHNAIAQAEAVTGHNLLEAAYYIPTATILRGMLWASVLKAHPEVTIEEVGAWINPRNFRVIREALLAAWFGSVPDQKEGEAGETEGEVSPNTSPSLTSGPAAATTSASPKKNSGRSRRGSSTSSAKGTAKSSSTASSAPRTRPPR